jgi:hypothetical protein
LSAASDPYRASPLKTRSFSPGLANLDFEMKVFTYGYRAKNSAQARVQAQDFEKEGRGSRGS